MSGRRFGNLQAYEARVRNYVSQTDVYMSALIQTGIDMNKGGVMITKDPFNEEQQRRGLHQCRLRTQFPGGR